MQSNALYSWALPVILTFCILLILSFLQCKITAFFRTLCRELWNWAFRFFRWHCSCRCQDKWQGTASVEKQCTLYPREDGFSMSTKEFFCRQYFPRVKIFKLRDLKDLSSKSLAIVCAVAFFWTCFTKPEHSQNFSISRDIFSSQSIPAWQSYLAEIESDPKRKWNIGTFRSSSSSYLYPDTLRKTSF